LVQLLRQVKQLHVEVQIKMKPVDSLLDVENVFGFFERGIYLSDLGLPGCQIVILTGLQGLLKVIANLF